MNKKNALENVENLTPKLLVLMFAISFATIIFGISIASAESLYVTPSAEVAIRTGQGTEYKIVSMVKDGARVEFLEEEGFHTKVRLQSGKEGWMLSRYLSPDPPLDQVVHRLQIENDKLKEKSASINDKINELNLSLKTAQKELEELRLERDRLSQDYDTLQKDTADVVQIKKDLDLTVKENTALLNKLALVEEKYNALKKDSKMYWFLVGAGVLLAGIILGKMPGPSRRRKSSLL